MATGNYGGLFPTYETIKIDSIRRFLSSVHVADGGAKNSDVKCCTKNDAGRTVTKKDEMIDEIAGADGDASMFVINDNTNLSTTKLIRRKYPRARIVVTDRVSAAIAEMDKTASESDIPVVFLHGDMQIVLGAMNIHNMFDEDTVILINSNITSITPGMLDTLAIIHVTNFWVTVVDDHTCGAHDTHCSKSFELATRIASNTQTLLDEVIDYVDGPGSNHVCLALKFITKHDQVGFKNPGRGIKFLTWQTDKTLPDGRLRIIPTACRSECGSFTIECGSDELVRMKGTEGDVWLFK